MPRKVTPSQLQSMLRQAEQKRRQAVDKYNQAVRKHNQQTKQAVDDYNRAARAPFPQPKSSRLVELENRMCFTICSTIRLISCSGTGLPFTVRLIWAQRCRTKMQRENAPGPSAKRLPFGQSLLFHR